MPLLLATEYSSSGLQPLVSGRAGTTSRGGSSSLPRDTADLSIIARLNQRVNNVIDTPGPTATVEPRTVKPWWDTIPRIAGGGYPSLNGTHPSGYDTDTTATAVDGMEDAWETSKIIDVDPVLPPNTLQDVLPYDDFDRNGYSNIEDYLNSRAANDLER